MVPRTCPYDGDSGPMDTTVLWRQCSYEDHGLLKMVVHQNIALPYYAYIFDHVILLQGLFSRMDEVADEEEEETVSFKLSIR